MQQAEEEHSVIMSLLQEEQTVIFIGNREPSQKEDAEIGSDTSIPNKKGSPGVISLLEERKRPWIPSHEGHWNYTDAEAQK